jgi:hypothetical protein
MARKAGSRDAPGAAAFSPAWVIVSYFLICGGLCAAAAGYAAVGARDPSAGYAAFFVGAALGGFLAGRASPHKSYAEPAIAAALVVVSVLLFVRATPMGKMALSFVGEQVNRHAMIAGGLGFAGGFFGAVVGEATQPRDPSFLPVRWTVIGAFISLGALFAGGTAAAILLLNDAAESALAQMWQTGAVDPAKPLVTEDRVIIAAAAAAASAALLGGFVTQLGAPRRMLLPAAAGVFLAMAGSLMAIAAAVARGKEMVGPALAFGGAAAAAGFLAALVAYALFKRG